MAKMEQILKIKPATELNFFGPFNQQVSSIMHLTNPSDKKVCFKIKTTAPKRYCVKPNSGVVDPEETVKISVSLQPFDFDPQEKSKHKFMVQSMYAPEGEINQDVLWREVDSSQLMDSKLRCVFVIPDSNSATAAASAATTANGGGFKGGVQPSAPLPPADHLTNSHQPPDAPNNEHFMTSNKGDTKGDIVGEGDSSLRKSVEEIRKLQEEVSTLRQENIQLREEALRQQRLATSRIGANAVSPSSTSSSPSSRQPESLKVAAINPDATAMSTTYLYLAMAILVVGIVIGKWIF